MTTRPSNLDLESFFRELNPKNAPGAEEPQRFFGGQPGNIGDLRYRHLPAGTALHTPSLWRNRAWRSPGTTQTAFTLLAHIHLVAQKFTGKQIKWEVVTRPAVGGWSGHDFPSRRFRDFSFALHACGSDESLPVRLFWRPHARVPLHAADDPALCLEDFWPVAGPH